MMKRVQSNQSSDIILPSNETRKFSGGTLENNIKYVNIEDKSLEKSSLIVSVNVGSIAENLEFQGLAHFLEHMLFLGSKKYPNESYFDDFLSKNGGYSNAYTDTYQTVYYFSVLDNSFEKCIDIMSRFFIDPLFDKNSVDREINAIESEHKKNIQSDTWRFSYLTDLISKKDSMINKFSTGNLQSLKKPNVRKEMIKFYKKYYISSNIKVSIISSMALSKTTEFINKYFSSIKKSSASQIANGIVKTIKPFYNQNSESFYFQTINDISILNYLWEIPTFDSYYKNNLATYFVTEILMTGDKKSMSYFLISKGLIKGLNARVEEEGKLNITFELTKFKNWVEVDSYFRFYIEKLKTKSSNEFIKDICDYQYKKDKLLFNIGTKSDSLDLAMKLANNLHYYEIKDCNYATVYPIKLEYNKVKELILEFVNFNKVKMILGSKKPINLIESEGLNGFNSIESIDHIFEKEIYYDLKYCKISLKLMPIKEFDFEFTTKNPYLDINPIVNKNIKIIGTKDSTKSNNNKMNLNSKIQSSTTPRRVYLTHRKDKTIESNSNSIESADINEIWFGNSYEFNEAIIYSKQIFTNINFLKNLETFLFIKIFVQYVNYKLAIEFYLENELGYSRGINLKTVDSKVELSISGWNNRFENYFISVMKYLIDLNYDKSDNLILQTLFTATKQEYLKISNENPWQYSDYLFTQKTTNFSYDYNTILKFMDKKIVSEGISIQSKKSLEYQFIENFDLIKKLIFDESHFKIFMYGNTNVEILKKNLLFSKYYFNNKKKCVINKSILFDKEIDILHPNKKETNNCLSLYYYISEFSVDKISMLLLFSSSIQQKFYDSIRTKQQFGYLVKCMITKTNSEYYFIQKVQSERSIDDIENAINKFNESFVLNYKEDGFDKLKKSLHDELKEPDNSTYETYSRFQNEISNNKYLFDRSIILADKVINIKFTDFMFFMKQFLYDLKPVKIIVRGNKKK